METGSVWRVMLILTMLLGGLLSAPVVAAQEKDQAPADLAAMLPSPDALPEPGYQFARGGYLAPDGVRYLLERRYALEDGAVEALFEAAGWRQSYTGTLVLLSDRASRLSDPLVAVTATIHAFADEDGAVALETLLTGAPPEGAEARDTAVEGATTWRVVTSQDDSLVTVVRSDRFVVEVETAGRRRTPTADEHAAAVVATLERVRTEPGPGLSQRFLRVRDDRLVPVAVVTEYPLAHAWYRMLDGEVIPAAGELDPPAPSEIAAGVDTIAMLRQTAELASQSWLAVEVVLARFASPADADAFEGVLRDPLDRFASSEETRSVPSTLVMGEVVAISGEARVGGRYSGYRITLVEGDTVAQLTVRATGNTQVAQEAAEEWAQRQRACLATDDCKAMPVAMLLRTSDAATPAGQAVGEGAYRSPVGPWSVAFDPAVWQADDTFARGGYDYLYLRANAMDVTLETIVDHRGDPEQCVLDELDRLREAEAHARISVGSDDPDEAPGGLTDDHGWIVYTVEPLSGGRDGEEYVIRIDCWTLVPGSTSLVMQTRAPSDSWSQLAPQAEALRSRIEIEGVPVGRETGDLPGVASIARSDEMIDRRPWVGIAA